MGENINVISKHHESNWCEWGKHKMEMQRVYMIEPVSWICMGCIWYAVVEQEVNNDNNP